MVGWGQVYRTLKETHQNVNSQVLWVMCDFLFFPSSVLYLSVHFKLSIMSVPEGGA